MLEFIIVAVALGAFLLWRRGGFNLSNSGGLGAAMSSGKAKWGLGIVVIAVILGLICWFFWSDLVSLQNSLLGPNIPWWCYVVGIVGIVIIIGLFRLNKEGRARTANVAEWIIGFAAVAGSLIIFSNWEKEDALCPDKQAITSVPATGMVLDLQACWDESFMVLDLRQTGVPKLAFNDQSSVLQGRTVDEFAYMQTNQPGSYDGQGLLRFNRSEMMRLGIPKLSIFIAPAAYQPGAVPRFNEATLEALSK